MKKSVLCGIAVLVLVAATFGTSHAVNFYDGARAREGLYFLTYTSVYFAEDFTNHSGNTVNHDFGYFKAEELVRFCYYTPNFVATALIPYDYVEVRSLNQNSNGLGDINLGAGYFLPIRSVDILPMVFVKFPTGEYDRNKIVNVGSNQYDIKPTVFLYKGFGDFSVDAAAKYFIRLENEDTHVSPGDELYLQLLLGYKVTDRFKLGPSINWMLSRDKEVNGVKVANSSREALSVGADFYYKFPKVSVTFTYLYDAYAENTTKGNFFQLKTVYYF